jgi:hypothetical protein
VVDGNMVRVKPTLINPGDMIELQILSSGLPGQVELGGRVADVTFEQLPRLPYPPGSGPEGEMNPIDRFMWWVPVPVGSVALAITFALNTSSSTAVRIVLPLATLLVGLVLYPLRSRYLVRRRAMWTP